MLPLVGRSTRRIGSEAEIRLPSSSTSPSKTLLRSPVLSFPLSLSLYLTTRHSLNSQLHSSRLVTSTSIPIRTVKTVSVYISVPVSLSHRALIHSHPKLPLSFQRCPCPRLCLRLCQLLCPCLCPCPRLRLLLFRLLALDLLAIETPLNVMGTLLFTVSPKINGLMNPRSLRPSKTKTTKTPSVDVDEKALACFVKLLQGDSRFITTLAGLTGIKLSIEDKDVADSPYADIVHKAKLAELDNMHRKGVLRAVELVPLDEAKRAHIKLVKGRWVSTIKVDHEGNESAKARFVAKGF